MSKAKKLERISVIVAIVLSVASLMVMAYMSVNPAPVSPTFILAPETTIPNYFRQVKIIAGENITPLEITGYTTQTFPLLDLKTSAGASVFSVTGSGVFSMGVSSVPWASVNKTGSSISDLSDISSTNMSMTGADSRSLNFHTVATTTSYLNTEYAYFRAQLNEDLDEDVSGGNNGFTVGMFRAYVGATDMGGAIVEGVRAGVTLDAGAIVNDPAGAGYIAGARITTYVPDTANVKTNKGLIIAPRDDTNELAISGSQYIGEQIYLAQHVAKSESWGLDIYSEGASANYNAAISLRNGGSEKYGYGIDMNDMSVPSAADIRLSQGETIDNVADGVVGVSGNLSVTGQVTFTGGLSGANGTLTGDLAARAITTTNQISAAMAILTGDLSTRNITATGGISVATVSTFNQAINAYGGIDTGGTSVVLDADDHTWITAPKADQVGIATGSDYRVLVTDGGMIVTGTITGDVTGNVTSVGITATNHITTAALYINGVSQTGAAVIISGTVANSGTIAHGLSVTPRYVGGCTAWAAPVFTYTVYISGVTGATTIPIGIYDPVNNVPGVGSFVVNCFVVP